MRWIFIPLLVTLLLPLLSRPALADTLPPPDPAMLVGAWTYTDGRATENVTFNKDGSFSQDLKADSKDTTISGTYKVKGRILTQTCTASSDSTRVGQSYSVVITSVSDDKLVLQDGPGKQNEIDLTRVKDKN